MGSGAVGLDWSSALYAAVGSGFTGLALGFGSKFWHDVLSIMFELKSMARNRGSLAEKMKSLAAGTATPGASGGKKDATDEEEKKEEQGDEENEVDEDEGPQNK